MQRLTGVHAGAGLVQVCSHNRHSEELDQELVVAKTIIAPLIS